MTINRIKKVARYASIYGLGRALFKAVGRSNIELPLVWSRCSKSDIAIIGCGQFGLTTIGYFLTSEFGRRIRWCFDINPTTSTKAARILGAQHIADDFTSILDDDNIRYVYISSNHASHTYYSVAALRKGKDVYVEKPISVSFSELYGLREVIKNSTGRIYAGYNRPFSKSILHLRDFLRNPSGGVTMSCFVSGHIIDDAHWYRRPEEGTRICGNAGHWIDLFIHMLSWRSYPTKFRIQIQSANPSVMDDDFCLSITTDKGDLFSLVLTARTEPFEGINETINFQWDGIIAKIDDFRRMRIWRGSKIHQLRSWPKDVGHRRAIMQPFERKELRAWQEIEISTFIMLHVADMVRVGLTSKEVSLSDALELFSEDDEK
jgi:predicted dehydrogenase